MEQILKIMFNIIFAFLLLILLLPIYLLVFLFLLFFQGWPVFFYQKRVGKGFKVFNLFKYRTMRVDSNGPLITVKDDQRVTFSGKLMRRLKADELPQILNVLVGNLNFVGPRPEVPKYVNKKDFFFLREIKPGLTDFSSILFANEEKVLLKLGGVDRYNDLLKIKLEVISYYLEVKSFWVDIKILTFTILSFLAPKTINKMIKKEINKKKPALIKKITDIGI